MRLEDLTSGMSVLGISPIGPVDLIAVDQPLGETRRVVYRSASGQLGEQILMRANEPALQRNEQPRTPFDADPEEFKLAAEAVRIQSAALTDPMLAVTSSDLEPLPHQIDAVYGHMLDQVPLRFLLADDPGAGKTIMAGLYIKELMLRGDLSRCLIVAPGGLVEQWQNELREKFGLRFDVLGAEMIKATPRGANVFAEHPRLIVRMDQVSRNDQLKASLEQCTWDVVVIDEAHRMSAHFYGRKIEATRRYGLGQLLGETAHHLLLMTATPHTGKDADFQLFLALLDADRFEGRFAADGQRVSTDGLMLRRIKEDLLTFSGTPLFPIRKAYTVPYQLSASESELYQMVTDYVRQEFNRADQLEKGRGNTVGFALTVLQRRLASSPEAILRSLQRRQPRLQDRLAEALARPQTLADGLKVNDLDDAYDDFPTPEQEVQEEEVVDAATAARSAEELRIEIRVLIELIDVAERVHQSGTDRKWSELSALLSDHPEMTDGGVRRKLIVFTEHRDTLNYLRTRIGRQLGGDAAVVTIHGGMARDARQAAQRRFTDDPSCLVLVATDAAGEGLNLQRAHLMVNYDLPWNPNRIEQRFGRIHRIGQKHMCHLWNLVAANTLEGEVFHRLLGKIEEQNAALRGKVFDVLGEAFEGQPLHNLLIRAVRQGDDPDVRGYLERVIDERVGDTAVKLLQERALHHDFLAATDASQVSVDLEEARAGRLQPHYVEGFFRDAFTRAGGRMIEREPKRFQLGDVPPAVREFHSTAAPIRLRYERVCFDRTVAQLGSGPPVELLTPGHPLLDGVVKHTIEEYTPALERGTILVDRLDLGEDLRLLVAVNEEIVDGTDRSIAKRFAYVELWPDGRHRAGSAPFLDYAVPSDEESDVVQRLASQGWPAMARAVAESWAAGQDLPTWYAEVSERRRELVVRTRGLVEERLNRELAQTESQLERLGELRPEDGGTREKRRSLEQRLGDLRRRLAVRLAELTKQAHTQARPPAVVAIALVVPQGLLDRVMGRRNQPVHHYSATMAEIDRRAIARVVHEERGLGRRPEVMAHNNPGYDIRSRDPEGHLVHIEVKGRESGADTFFVTNREIRTGQNADNYRLALVDVDLDDRTRETVRYVRDPFVDEKVSALVNGVQFRWKDMWERGGPPA
jgi:superfamily II DNA or RNA helicase